MVTINKSKQGTYIEKIVGRETCHVHNNFLEVLILKIYRLLNSGLTNKICYHTS